MALTDVQVITQFINKATVWILARVKNVDGVLTDPTAIKITVIDPDGVQKAGYISVSASASFTAGLVVTGTTSLATGIIISKPDGTTLELQQVTGVWESGETITDTSTGTSTTTSLLLGAAMTKYDSNVGIYEYLYHKGETVDPMDSGEWRGMIDVIDGTGYSAVISPQGYSFKVR